jgi:hypothetical protein
MSWADEAAIRRVMNAIADHCQTWALSDGAIDLEAAATAAIEVMREGVGSGPEARAPGTASRAPQSLNGDPAFERQMEKALAEPTLVEALAMVAIWETDRAVVEAMRGERAVDGSLYDTNFHWIIERFFARWPITRPITHKEPGLLPICATVEDVRRAAPTAGFYPVLLAKEGE